jgi:hypothetical protein
MNETHRDALTELGIDSTAFGNVFAEYWSDDDDIDDRVHVTTDVETEVIDALTSWRDEVHEAISAGEKPRGLFLVVEGAQATGKTTMTRYIRDQLDPIQNPELANPPMILPIWCTAEANPSPLTYQRKIKNEGERYFSHLSVPDPDEKMELLSELGSIPEDSLERASEAANTSEDQIRNALEEIGIGEGRDPGKVLKELAEQGYIFVFIFDEMVSVNEREEAQSVLKWFEKHLYPNVGFVLFTHPEISSATQNIMRDQARRRNLSLTLDIAGNEYQLDDDFLINIRGKQGEIIDLRDLLSRSFDEVYKNSHSPYGPLSEENVDWLETLLEANGLIGNLIDGLRSAIEQYAQAKARDEDGGIGVYLFDECDRSMSTNLKVQFRAATSLEPDEQTPTVNKAKELITRSIIISDLSPEIREELQEHRVLIKDEDADEGVKLNPRLEELTGNQLEPASPVQNQENTQTLREVYETQEEKYEEEISGENRDTLRKNVEDSIVEILEWMEVHQSNIASYTTLSVPNEPAPPVGHTRFVESESKGRANRVQAAGGGLGDYEYEFLVYTIFNDESLDDAKVFDQIEDLYQKESGIFIFTDNENWSEPSWFDKLIDRDRSWDAEFTYGDITTVVEIPDLSVPWAAHELVNARGIEATSQIINTLRQLATEPTLPEVYELIWDLSMSTSDAASDTHEAIYNVYNGPTLSEAEAFEEIIDQSKERGFIEIQDIEGIRENYSHEVEALFSQGALKKVETDEKEFALVDSSYGGLKVMRNATYRNNPEKLNPISTVIVEKLSKVAEMEEDLNWRFKDERISDVISELESKATLIDYFIVENEAFETIEDEIGDDINELSTVSKAISNLRSEFNKQAYNRVKSELEQDADLWEQVEDEGLDDVSSIHKTLFYGRLAENPGSAQEEYLKEDEYYPGILYDTDNSIRSIIEDLKEAYISVKKRYQKETSELNDRRDDLQELILNGGDEDE